MDERTTGLILRTLPLTETSLIVQWLTRDFGRISTVAKGARRPKSPFAGKLDLFYLADLSYQPSRRSDLHTLREVSVREFFPALRRDMGALLQACYFSQLLAQTTETGTPLPALFELFASVLGALPDFPPRALTVFAFEMKLLAEQGLNPAPSAAGLTPGSREILSLLPAADWNLISRIQPAPGQTLEMDEFLRRSLATHFGRIAKCRASALPLASSGPGRE